MSLTCRRTPLGSATAVAIVLLLFVSLAGGLQVATAQPAGAVVRSSDGAVAPLIETVAGAVCSPSVATGIGIEPAAVAPDGAGGFYVTDAIHSVVCRVAADGTVRVAAGNGSAGYSGDGRAATATRLYTPSGLAVDSAGNLFIADRWNQRVRRVDARTGIITTVAGTGVPGGAGDGGRAVDAQLNFPIGVAVDRAGNLFIADSRNNRVRRVSSDGTITTLAGTGAAGSTGDGGPAASARLSFPAGLALSGTNLYVADASNNRIRRIDLEASKIYAFAGTGTPGGTGDEADATAATLRVPTGVAASGSTVYIADAGNNRVRVVRDGRISAFAGTGAAGFAGDGAAAATARLSFPSSVAVNGSNVLIVDQGNYRVRAVSTDTGTIRTVAGNGTQGFSGEGGDARLAELSQPTAFTWDRGRLLIADGHNNVVRRLEADGRLVTVAGTPGIPGATGDGGHALSATLGFITGIVTDARGNLFIADWGHRIRKVDAAGRITTLAGTGTAGFGGDGGPARAALLNKPSGLAVDAGGSLYVADSGNNRVRRFSAIAGEATGESPVSTVGGTGVAGFAGDGGSARSAAFNGPAGLAIDARGSLYIADEFNQRVRRIGIDGAVTTIAGTGVVGYSPEGTAATSSALNHPRAVAFDGEALIIADTGNCIVRRIPSPGTAGTTISTVAGWTPVRGVTPVCDYAGERVHPTSGGAKLFNPSGLAIDAEGALYIADSLNHRVRRVSGQWHGLSSVPEARDVSDACPPGSVPEGGFEDVPPGSTHEATIDCVNWWGVANGKTSATYAPGESVTRAQMASFIARAIERSGGSLPTSPPDAFRDDSTSVHHNNINRLAAAGIVAGRGDGTYEPSGLVTRAQMATFLVRAYEYRAQTTLPWSRNWFSDDDAESFAPHHTSINKAADARFTGGTASGGYEPGKHVLRGQMASFLARWLDLSVESGHGSPPSG